MIQFFAVAMILLIWVIVETIFFGIYLFYFRLRAADTSRKYTTSQPFRDYNQQCHPERRRHLLFKRILERLEATSVLEKKDFKNYLDRFLIRWFSIETDTGMCNRMENDKMPKAYKKNTDIATINHEGMQEFLSWGFFDKFLHELENWEKEELNIMFGILEEKYGIIYPKKNNRLAAPCEIEFPRLKPRRFTLEAGNPRHRPFISYAVIWILRQISYSLMRLMGYQRFYSSCGSSGKLLSYWFKPGKTNIHRIESRAILFFHGIAPGGLMGYLPFLRNCLNGKGIESSPIFLFENLPITYHLSFEALSEEETVHGVETALRAHGFSDRNCQLVLCGHSFGSFITTWLLKAENLVPMIQKLILLDPVSILLSNPDVVLNVLYNGGEDCAGEENFQKIAKRHIINLVASSELFIGNYLRRHFAWYNSELWIEDIPEHVDVHIYLAENDAIINANEVRQELDRHHHKHRAGVKKSIQYKFWEGHAHGDCVVNPRLWIDVSHSFLPLKKID